MTIQTTPPSLPRSTTRAAMMALFAGLVVCAACDDKKKTPVPGESATSQGAVKKADAPKKEETFDAGHKADVFTTVLAADPETFDPGKMSGAPEGRLAMNLFEGLLMPGPTTEGLKDTSELVRPGMAESYEVSDDGLTYTFKLRKNAKWSDGKPVTAKDFAYAWKRVLTPGFPADYAQMMWLIKGAQSYNKGESTDWGTVGVTTPDDYTLVVTLNSPTPYFPELVAFYTFFPVPQAAIEEHGDAWTKPEHIVTNGAYRLKAFKPQREALLERNPDYWDVDNVKLETVRLRIISDLNAMVNAYQTGELHWSGVNLPVAQAANLLLHPDYMQEPMLGIYYYRINVKNDGPLKNEKVRQALNMSVDRKQLTTQTLKGLYKPATNIVPPGMPGYSSTGGVKGNSKKAKKMLAEAGYDAKNPLKIKVLYNTDENHKITAESLQSMWKRIGVEVELVNKEWKTYLQDIDTLSYEVARAGWIGDYNDPMTFLDMWVTGNGNNDTGWSNAEYDTLIASATAEPDKAKRLEMLQQAEALLMEKGPVIPIYFYTNNILASKKISGFKQHNRDIHLFKYMSLPSK